jgi:hypothetical protein
VTLERWTAFVGVLLVVVFTPGPDFAVVLRHALAGPVRGVRAAAGNVTGLAGHTAAAALGLSAVLVARPDVLTAIRLAGAAYPVPRQGRFGTYLGGPGARWLRCRKARVRPVHRPSSALPANAWIHRSTHQPSWTGH